MNSSFYGESLPLRPKITDYKRNYGFQSLRSWNVCVLVEISGTYFVSFAPFNQLQSQIDYSSFLMTLERVAKRRATKEIIFLLTAPSFSIDENKKND